MAALADVLNELEGHTTLLRQMATALGERAAAASPGGKGGAPAGGGGGLAGGGLAALTAPVGSLGAALTGVTGALTAIPNVVKSFVEAFSPVQVEVFMDAMRDLMATIGQAFEPIFTVFTGLVRTISDIVAPAFEALRPVIQQLAEMFGRILVPVARLFAAAFEAVLPIVRALLPVLEVVVAVVVAIVDVFRVLQVVFSAVLEAIGGLLGGLGDWRGALGSIRDAIQSATRAVILFTARLLKFIGAETALANLQRAFGPVQGQRKTAAPKDFGLGGIEDVLREATLAAAAAAGGADQRTTEEHLAGISGQIAEIARSGASFGEQFATLSGFLQGVGKAVETITDVVKRIWEFLSGAARRAPELAGRVANRFERATEQQWGFNPFELLNRLRRGGGGG